MNIKLYKPLIFSLFKMAGLPQRLRNIEQELGNFDICNEALKVLIDSYRISNPDGSVEHSILSSQLLDRVIAGETTFESELIKKGDDFLFLREGGNLAIFFGNLNLLSNVKYLDKKIRELYG